MDVHWNGDGMPPVGAVCEISSQGADWGVATIQYTADNVVVWRWENQAKGQVCACYRHEIEMRPLNTPEREKAIAEMTEIAGGTYALRDDIIQRLYNAGYRK